MYRTASATKCNVTDWDAQVEIFELAMKKYGSVDIVVRVPARPHIMYVLKEKMLGTQRWNFRK
jgi:hypothetical protein